MPLQLIGYKTCTCVQRSVLAPIHADLEFEPGHIDVPFESAVIDRRADEVTGGRLLPAVAGEFEDLYIAALKQNQSYCLMRRAGGANEGRN